MSHKSASDLNTAVELVKLDHLTAQARARTRKWEVVRIVEIVVLIILFPFSIPYYLIRWMLTKR